MNNIHRVIIFVFAIAYAVLLFSALDKYGREYYYIPESSLKDVVIVIDPGHGGVDGGASLGSHFHEKDINLDISLKLREILIKDGAKVIMTRDCDISLENKSELKLSRYRRDLDGRHRIINNSKADVFVSIHSNCLRSNTQIRGAIIFYNPASEKGKKLAQLIGGSIDEIVYKSFLENNQLKSKVLSKDLYILRSTKIPGVLVETGYMTHHEEGRLLKQEDFQLAMAEAVYNGLKKFFSDEYAD